MTLLIAWILIDANHLGDGMKVWAFVLWVLHVMYHEAPSAKAIRDAVLGKEDK
jgi:hypothetical protein